MIIENLPLEITRDIEDVNKIPVIQKLLDVICRTTNMGFAAVSRITEDNWITCTTKDNISFGLKPGDKLDVETTLCYEVQRNREAVVIENVATNETYCDHEAPKIYNVQSHISFPIYRRNGEFFGTLCAIDPAPHSINTPEIRGMFQLFSELISFHLSAIEDMQEMEDKLQEEQENTILRERFIAILGHDLKNPIATMRMSADILLKVSQEEMVVRHAKMIKSTSYRMNGLIENILDFARGKLGEGITLEKESNNRRLEKTIYQVVNELKVSSPAREIEVDFWLDHNINCDCSRVGQLLANLLSNADKHGDTSSPIHVKVSCTPETFTLSVTNKGNIIPEKNREQLFEPFYLESDGAGQKGLGLGLYIASEIAKAHNGELLIDSTEEETCFSLHFPLQ